MQEKFLGQGAQDNEVCRHSCFVLLKMRTNGLVNSLLLSKPRTNRFPTSFVDSTRVRLAPMCPSRTRRLGSVKRRGYGHDTAYADGIARHADSVLRGSGTRIKPL